MICDMITESDDRMRIFKKPIVNFSADDYYYLIDDNSLWLESILTKDISTAYLRSLDINNIGIFELGNYPSHTSSWKAYLTCIIAYRLLLTNKSYTY